MRRHTQNDPSRTATGYDFEKNDITYATIVINTHMNVSASSAGR